LSMNVSIMKANLKHTKGNKEKLPNVYCSVGLGVDKDGEQEVDKSLPSFETNVIPSSLQPIWEYSDTLIIRLRQNLVVQLFHHNIVQQDACIGSVCIPVETILQEEQPVDNKRSSGRNQQKIKYRRTLDVEGHGYSGTIDVSMEGCPRDPKNKTIEDGKKLKSKMIELVNASWTNVRYLIADDQNAMQIKSAAPKIDVGASGTVGAGIDLAWDFKRVGPPQFGILPPGESTVNCIQSRQAYVTLFFKPEGASGEDWYLLWANKVVNEKMVLTIKSKHLEGLIDYAPKLPWSVVQSKIIPAASP